MICPVNEHTADVRQNEPVALFGNVQSKAAQPRVWTQREQVYLVTTLRDAAVQLPHNVAQRHTHVRSVGDHQSVERDVPHPVVCSPPDGRRLFCGHSGGRELLLVSVVPVFGPHLLKHFLPKCSDSLHYLNRTQISCDQGVFFPLKVNMMLQIKAKGWKTHSVILFTSTCRAKNWGTLCLIYLYRVLLTCCASAPPRFTHFQKVIWNEEEVLRFDHFSVAALFQKQ